MIDASSTEVACTADVAKVAEVAITVDVANIAEVAIPVVVANIAEVAITVVVANISEVAITVVAKLTYSCPSVPLDRGDPGPRRGKARAHREDSGGRHRGPGRDEVCCCHDS